MTVAYNFSDLQELSSAIGKAHSAVETCKGDINSSAGKLKADWDGSAGESWGTVQHKWTTACDNLVTALHQLAQTVLSSSDAMSQTEAKNAGLFNGM